MPPSPRFYSKPEYFAELIQRFDAAVSDSRLLLMSMTLDPDEPVVADVLASLLAAAERGADVTLLIDAHSFLANDRQLGPLFYHARIPGRVSGIFGRKQAILERLNSPSHARAVVLNLPSRAFSLPVAGRSHIKLAIVDDYYFVGGCNLDQPVNIDVMIGQQDDLAADQLYSLMRRIADDSNTRHFMDGTDQTIPIEGGDRLLIDSGLPNQSLILNSALELIDSAEKWLTITCQFFPNSVTAQHLLAAEKRGVHTEILFSPASKHGLIGDGGQRLSQLIERSRLPAGMFARQLDPGLPLLHAKIIASDKGLMIGSHNYVRAGVRLGTAELAFQTSDARTAEHARSKIHTLLGE